MYYNISAPEIHYFPFEKILLRFYDEKTDPKKYKHHFRIIKMMYGKKWKFFKINNRNALGKKCTFVYYSVYFKENDLVHKINAYNLIPAFRYICKKLKKEKIEEKDILQIKKRMVFCFAILKKEYETLLKSYRKKKGFKTRICG